MEVLEQILAGRLSIMSLLIRVTAWSPGESMSCTCATAGKGSRSEPGSDANSPPTREHPNTQTPCDLALQLGEGPQNTTCPPRQDLVRTPLKEEKPPRKGNERRQAVQCG